jgi:hypothetical protein
VKYETPEAFRTAPQLLIVSLEQYGAEKRRVEGTVAFRRGERLRAALDLRID